MAGESTTVGSAHEIVRVHEDGLPVYRLGDRPAHLLTKNELNRAGLTRAYRQPHLGYARWYYYKREGETPLYDRHAARAKRECSPAQLAALEKGRREAEHRAFLARAWRCFDCAELTDEPRYYAQQIACGPCATIRHRVAELVDTLDLAPALPPRPLDQGPRGPQEWAAALLDGHPVLTLDTETSALQGWAVEVAVCHADGRTAFESLVTPGGPISQQSHSIHGIGKAMLADAGAPRFSGVLDALGAAIDGCCVAVYNLSYDLAVIAREVHRHARQTVGLEDAEALAYTGAWLQRARWVDLMLPYSEWHGEWNAYRNDYRWQPLPYGNHRAAADAAGAAQLLRELATGSAPRLPESERGPRPADEYDDYA
ncbi:3'-5' exonuclease [Streptomyces sp. NPDC001492]